MRYLITGSTGLVGNEIVNQLSKTTHSIRCLLHKTKPINNYKTIEYYYADITSSFDLKRIVKNVDIIIHCAALINGNSQEKYLDINVTGTKNLLRAAERNRVKKFIYLSSWSTLLNGGSYSLSKLLAEQEVSKYKNHLIIKPADIYSLDKSHIHTYIEALRSYPLIPVIGDGNNLISPVYVVDLVKAILKLIHEDIKISTILGPDVYSFNEFNSLLNTYFTLHKKSLHIPIPPIRFLTYILRPLPLRMPVDEERINRLIAGKVIINRFDYRKYNMKPLQFINALPLLSFNK